MADQGLLFVLGETGKDVSEAEFNDWYDNEHGPARLGVPGFTKAIRLRATDGKEPSYLAVYDMTSPDVAFGAGYKALNTNATPRDKDIVPRTGTLHRRVYNKISTLEKPGEHTFPTKFTTTVTFITPPEIDEVFNKWYEEEHVPQLSGVPGYVRCRRYRLVDSADLGRTKFPEPIPNYIAIYDTDKDNWMEEEAFRASLTTPMTIEMMKNPWEARRWRLHTELQPPK